MSVTGITRNSGDRLEHWITRAREYADEVVLLVDESATDQTVDVAREHADSVRLVEHPPFIEVYYDLALRHASGDWILWLDDDEFMGKGLAETRDHLLADRELTHYLLPYRWVVRGDDGDRWLTTFPWHPNPRPRLFRNVGSTFSHRGRLHSPIDIAGEGRTLHPDEAVVYHLDLAWRTRGEREAKVARYRGNNAPSCEEYYLYEDYERSLRSEPVPEPLEREASPQALEAAAERRSRVPVPLGPRASVAEEQARIAGFWASAPVFAAEYLGTTTPASVLPNRGYAVEVTVRNTSSVRWRTSGPERGRIVLSYHWATAEHGVILRQGDLSLLDEGLEPGATTTVLAGLWTPYQPGTYTLQWDLFSQDVNWFSERGVLPHEVTVTVEADERLLAKPRAVADLPPAVTRPAAVPEPEPAASATTRLAGRLVEPLHRVRTRRRRETEPEHSAPIVVGANVVPIRQCRVLDTRDGTGVAGAVHGPVAAGTTVTLQVGGTNDIPDYAAGVVGTLSIPDSDYNGFVNVTGGSGPPDGIVAGYFVDAGPSAFQVLARLVDGSLSIWLSDNWPGHAHILLDVVAYLNPG